MRHARSAFLTFVSALCLLAVFTAAASAAERAPVEQEPPPAAQPAGPPDDWSRILDEGVIVFGVAADYPPFEFYNSKFELDGFDIALAKALGEQLGLEVRFSRLCL